jgi:hypothetical protein
MVPARLRLRQSSQASFLWGPSPGHVAGDVPQQAIIRVVAGAGPERVEAARQAPVQLTVALQPTLGARRTALPPVTAAITESGWTPRERRGVHHEPP